MNRRTFFNFLGSAVIGTVIALNLPNAIAPIPDNIEGFKIQLTHKKKKHWLAQKLQDHAHDLYCNEL